MALLTECLERTREKHASLQGLGGSLGFDVTPNDIKAIEISIILGEILCRCCECSCITLLFPIAVIEPFEFEFP